MSKIKIISVCGSGTVTSSMIANKVTTILEERGYQTQTVECNPNGVDNLVTGGKWDIIVHTSPLKRTYDIPNINAVGLLTGMEEELFIENLMNAVNNL